MTKSQKFIGLRAGAASIALGVALISTSAFAQDQVAEEAPATPGDEIIVTGSRIQQPNLEAISPVTVVNSADIKLQGTTRTEDLINSLPQAFAGQGGNLANGATGTATVDLRGLGSERTLVLINGRRLMPGDPASTVVAADINFIPASMVKRVEVLTGGASSVYGSDAVSGVVNFVMDTEFEGFRVDGQYSFYQHNNDTNSGIIDGLNRRGFGYPTGNVVDGGTVDVTASFGAGFDDGRGHIVAYAGYRKLQAVTQDRRDYSACASQALATAMDLRCGGSATSANGTFFDWASNTWQIGANRTFDPGFTPYNFAPTNYYQRPGERYTAGLFANYEINDSIKPYLEFMFMDDRTVAQIAPSGNFGNTLSVNCDNPLLSAQQLAIVCAPGNLVNAVLPTGFPLVGADQDGDGVVDPVIDFVNTVPGAANATYNRGFLQTLRRNVEGGPRQSDLQHTSFRVVGGVKGDLDPVWSYDASYVFGRTNYNQTYFNDFSISRLTKALDVVTNPATGAATCRSVLDGTDPNCVPYDIFQLNGVSQAAVDYLSTPGFMRGNVEQKIFNASVTGLLGEYGVKTPWADTGLGINVGFEYRKDSLRLDTDTAFTTGDLSGQGGATVSTAGSFDVKEFFVEGRMPLVEDSFIYALSVEGGYRYSKYQVSGGDSFSTDTYKFGLDFAPVRDIRFRGSYNRAVRAPNIQELFAPNIVALNGNSDPCTGASTNPTDPTAGTVNGFTFAQCALTGVTAAQFGRLAGNPAGQYNGLIGGVATLEPEIATTKSLGVVFQPTFLPGFSATVDWFDIKIKNTIQQIGQDTIIDECLESGNFCELINRDATGSLWRSPDGYVRDLETNIGSVKTRGIDLNANYQTEIGSAGTVSFALVGTWLDKLVTDNGVSEPYDCAGFYGLVCGVPGPEWRHKFRVSFNTPSGIGISAQWRYFAAVDLDRTSDNPSLSGAFSPRNETIGAQSYFDLSATLRLADSYTFRLGVQNILDKEPPIIGANGSSGVINACASVVCSGNTYPQVYDALGRYVYAGVTLDF